MPQNTKLIVKNGRRTIMKISGGTRMISIQNITKSYQSVKAVDNVSFDVKPGEIVGFIGPNGAGKSTTIKILLNYIFADQGEASIQGMSCITHAKDIKRTLGYIPSEVNFYPELTALEVINYTMQMHNCTNTVFRDTLCADFHVDQHKKMKELSLGNKKKVAIVSALVIEPRVLIMDEPTNGLDPLIQKVLFQYTKQAALNKTTILISSHNLREIQEHCDRVIFIKQGRIIQSIDLNTLQLSGKFVKLKGDIHGLEHLASQVLSLTEDSIAAIFTISLPDLIQILQNRTIDDLVIEDVSIEHQFIEYYKEDVHETTR